MLLRLHFTCKSQFLVKLSCFASADLLFIVLVGGLPQSVWTKTGALGITNWTTW